MDQLQKADAETYEKQLSSPLGALRNHSLDFR